MEYFCPYCKKRHPHTNLRIGFDVGNKKIREVLLNNILPDAKERYSNYERCINTLFPDGQLSILQLTKDDRSTNTYYAFLDEFLDAFRFAHDLLTSLVNRRRTTVDEALLSEIERIVSDFQTKVFIDSFSNLMITDILRVTYARDREKKDVLREATGINESYPIICYECRNIMFEYAGECPEIVIGVLGTERVAKSSCIASTLHGFLLNDGNGNINDVFFEEPVNDLRWNEGAKKNLLTEYRQGWGVIKTETNTSSVRHCATLKARIRENSTTTKDLIVTFIDMAGEHLNDENGISNEWKNEYCELYKCVDVFWFCIDIVQLMQTISKEFLIKAGYDPGENEESIRRHIVNPGFLGANLGRLRNYLYPEDPNHNFPPTAIILTKSDLVGDSGVWTKVVPSHIFKQEAAYPFEKTVYDHASHKIERRPFYSLSNTVKTTLNGIRQDEATQTPAEQLIGIFDEFFPNSSYFSTSAYSRVAVGRPAEDEDRVKTSLDGPPV
ncbi:MAG: hypothetical protein GX802_03255, partial [Clostridiales bacterium]|nr:hypothetical protein [Clostridiales bacterium]